MPAIGTGDIGYWVLEKVMAGNRWHAEEDERGFIRTFYKVLYKLGPLFIKSL